MTLRSTATNLVKSTLLAASVVVATPAFAADLIGAGASFPFPVYAKWAEDYYKATGMAMNYQSIGSSGGVRQIRARTVDFGATDAPLKGAELEKDGLVQFPTVMGGVVPVVNLVGVKSGELKLTGEIVADIYLGKIVKWNDPRIAAPNPGLALPDAAITPVYRADGSGTTNVFTSYLGAVSKVWADGPGISTTIEWPVGQGGKGNEGVAALVKQTPNAIGYVEYAYAKQNGIAFAQMRNKAGKFVSPEAQTFQAAAVNADWTSTPGFGISLVDQAGDGVWPITAATFILVPKVADDSVKQAGVLKFFDWAFKNGDAAASSLDYVPLPEATKAMVHQEWRAHLSAAAQALAQ